ncbi:hypothetical protein Lfu02_66510 [Longispora fulva]|uniref:Uncharacterized protein n=1 Tax=Longispora fulva TaxID=619741 RepID=A0A8J7GUC7_9ACTN|nr:hypothetical protein [Longispora fulva]MBG6138614.1 hypothetical protein [Longispora fulva]GIG62279.1 hypothetical protein Lfu02_66510 [Longispora fulva]
MLELSTDQRNLLSMCLVGLVDEYGPGDLDALIFRDPLGRFGVGPGPQAPAGCEPVVTRAMVDRLMVTHVFVPQDFQSPAQLASFVETLCQAVRLP